MPLFDSDLELFRGQPLIASLDPSDQEALARLSILQRFPARVRLFSQGQLADVLFIMTEGLMAARSAFGKATTTVRLAGPQAVFPLGPVIANAECHLSVDVLLPSRIFMVPARAVRELARERAAFAFAIALELANGYRDMFADITSQRLTSSTYRLGAWLLAHSAEDGRVEPAIQKNEIAQLIGTTPENLSRSFSQLSSHGVLSGKSITITDRPRLEAFLVSEGPG